MRIYQKNKNWYFEFMLEGRRHHKACKGATDKSEAEQFAYDFKSNVYKGFQGYKSKKTKKLSELIKVFIAYSKTNKKSYKMDELFCRYFSDFIGNKDISDIKPIDIERYKTFRQIKKEVMTKDENGNEIKLERYIKPATINREFDTIRKMFSLAVENKWISENPCSRVKKLRVENKKDRFLIKEEDKRLLNACVGDKAYLKPIIIMALHTGMRRGEILNLKWNCVNFTQKFITILNSKSGKSRQIPISTKLLNELKKLPQDNEYVFINPDTKKPYYDLKRAFKSLCKNAGVTNLRFHDLRHTSATRMVSAGIDLVVVQDILGHADIRMTQRYSHPVPERKLQAIKALNNY